MGKNTREYNRNYQRRRRVILEVRGLCNQCGIEDIQVDRKSCPGCLEIMRKSRALRYAAKKGDEGDQDKS